ncbi:MAG TPA: hypothetical protein VJT84_12690 [Gaiellaceae bacterium]|nr:hypothetical protein [Gaiellaceae bacterium]
MRLLGSKRTVIALATTALAAGIFAAVALPALVSQQVINDANGPHFRVVRSIADGFDSGWHVHPGVAIVQVQQGAFQIQQGSCTARTVGAGDTYIEVPHLAVRAVATGRVVWTTTLITNPGDLPQIPYAAYSGNPNANPCP